MAPIREYLCDYCGHQYETLVYGQDPEDYATDECRCGSKAKVLPPLIGGYQGNMGPSSVRPKNSTSMPKKDAYTGLPKKEVKEPEQLEFDFDGGE